MKAIQCFKNVHMGLGHAGLNQIAKETANIDVEKLNNQEYLVFINRKQDKIKVLCMVGTAPFRKPGFFYVNYGRRLVMEAIQYIPRALGGGDFDFRKAEALALSQKLRWISETNEPADMITVGNKKRHRRAHGRRQATRHDPNRDRALHG